MDKSFLSRYLQIALHVTEAERGLAVDKQMNIVDQVNLDERTLQKPDFTAFVNTWVARAIEDQTTIITNNIITDPAKAPNTNTSFSDLRSVVCIPVRDHGAIYLDRHIRSGLISREMIDRLSEWASQVTLEDMQKESIEALLERFYNSKISS
jgi:hypothetical protein